MIYTVTVERRCSKCELVRQNIEVLTEAQLMWLQEWNSPDPMPCIRCKEEEATKIKILDIQEKEVKKIKEKYISGIRVSSIWTNKT